MYKVLLPGEALIDKFTINGKEQDKPGGAPANVAAAIAKFGVKSYFLGTVGNDQYGEFLKKIMLKNKINVEGMIFLNTQTTIANVKVDKNGERSFTFQRGADQELDFQSIPSNILNDFQILHLGSATAMLGGKLWQTYEELILKSKNKIIIFDPNYREALYKNKKNIFIERSKFIISKSTIVKISDEELEIITGEKDYVKGANELLKLGSKIILVTLGKAGTYVASKTFKQIVPSIKVSQIDTTGAGDAFIGFVVGEIASNKLTKNDLANKSFLQIVRKANICSAIVVTKVGSLTVIPSKEKVYTLYKKHQENKIKNFK